MENKNDIGTLLAGMNAEASLVAKQEIKQKLAAYINDLLVHDFSGLVQLLYRVDVDEQKLKDLLRQYPQEDAGLLIAELIVQRQEEKLKARSSSSPDKDIPEQDKW
jgi:hypothetical protein